MTEPKKYLFGPVPSRRLGLSLGVDIIPFKVCSLDCVYCQLGKTGEKTIIRSDFVPIEEVLSQLKETLDSGVKTDFVTISGSGEPTLNSQLGKIIDGIKKITDIPVALLTNSTLLNRPNVRADCAKADIVLPSLDAADQQTFEKINRPHPDIRIENLIDGLIAFRDEFHGSIWLEIFLIENINTDNSQIEKIINTSKRIRPDKIQLNTAVRPTAKSDIKRLSPEKMHEITKKFGKNCEIIADFAKKHTQKDFENKAQTILSMLKRRPCSLNDLAAAIGIHQNEALKYITSLQQQKLVAAEEKNGIIFFKAI